MISGLGGWYEWVRKPIFAKCHSERSEESYTLKVYEFPEVRFFAYAQNDSDNAASEFPNLLWYEK